MIHSTIIISKIAWSVLFWVLCILLSPNSPLQKEDSRLILQKGHIFICREAMTLIQSSTSPCNDSTLIFVRNCRLVSLVCSNVRLAKVFFFATFQILPALSVNKISNQKIDPQHHYHIQNSVISLILTVMHFVVTKQPLAKRGFKTDSSKGHIFIWVQKQLSWMSMKMEEMP